LSAIVPPAYTAPVGVEKCIKKSDGIAEDSPRYRRCFAVSDVLAGMVCRPTIIYC
jgi:hypothetical protein